jgi:hypothetical protein
MIFFIRTLVKYSCGCGWTCEFDHQKTISIQIIIQITSIFLFFLNSIIFILDIFYQCIIAISSLIKKKYFDSIFMENWYFNFNRFWRWDFMSEIHFTYTNPDIRRQYILFHLMSIQWACQTPPLFFSQFSGGNYLLAFLHVFANCSRPTKDHPAFHRIRVGIELLSSLGMT